MTRDRLLEQAIELLAIADFHSLTLKEERNQVVREGIELLRQPKPDQNELKLIMDQINYGMSVTQGGKRIDPMSIYKEQEPACPDCKAKVLYECVACSSNNYPPQRPWSQKTIEQKIEASIRHYTKEIERFKEVGDPHQFVGTYEGFVVCLESILENNT
jgi:hypothetical protein